MKKSNIKRLFSIFCLRIATKMPFGNRLRVLFVKWGGVKISNIKNTFIGDGVIFDSLNPENISIESHAMITMNCIILTHYIDTNNTIKGRKWKYGKVVIGEDAFIGAGTIICNAVTIGKNAIIGANSVVTKDIPDFCIAVGNPCHVIKQYNKDTKKWEKVPLNS